MDQGLASGIADLDGATARFIRKQATPDEPWKGLHVVWMRLGLPVAEAEMATMA